MSLCRKKGYRFFFIFIALTLIASFFSCSKNLNITIKNKDGTETEIRVGLPFSEPTDSSSVPKGSPSEWKYQKTIASPLTLNAANSTDKVGDLNKDQVEVIVYGKSFDTSGKVIVRNPDSVPPVYPTEFEPLSAPVDITSDRQLRTNHPIDKGSVSIAMSGSYNAGSRGLVVSGTFSR